MGKSELIKSALYGALIGDAIGVPYEFHYFDLPARVDIEMEPPVGFNRSHAGTPIGTYSDDGALMLALMDSLAAYPAFNLLDFTQRMVSFMRLGNYAVDNRVFDIGMQTQQGLAEFVAGTDPLLSGGSDEWDNGNGALMRVLPVALLGIANQTTIRIAMQQGCPTHGHVRSQLVCALYAQIAKNIFSGGDNLHDARIAAETTVRYYHAERFEEELNLIIDGRQKGTGTGYVLDTYWSALDCIEDTDNYEDAIRAAVSLGHDTDTTACVVGGLAGLIYGYNSIPERWKDVLRGKEFINKILSLFINSMMTI